MPKKKLRSSGILSLVNFLSTSFLWTSFVMQFFLFAPILWIFRRRKSDETWNRHYDSWLDWNSLSDETDPNRVLDALKKAEMRTRRFFDIFFGLAVPCALITLTLAMVAFLYNHDVFIKDLAPLSFLTFEFALIAYFGRIYDLKMYTKYREIVQQRAVQE